MERLFLATINTDYTRFLRKYDNKVSINYDDKEGRKYIGILFKVEDLLYFAPLSSPKPKHTKMKDNLDFMKIKNGKWGCINFNNMIPVRQGEYKKVDIASFINNDITKNYGKLLNNQLLWCLNKENLIIKKAKRLYSSYKKNQIPEFIKKRCCDFPLLEKVSLKYIKPKDEKGVN